MRKVSVIYLFSLLLALLYALAYAPYGFSDTDQGFIQALSWRIMQGQVPYLDFTYVRPPVSLYFHAGILRFLPGNWEVMGERVIFYLMMALIVAWSTISLQRYFSFRKLAISPVGLAILAFVLSVHNYPPMPWHTVDGLFWGALGFLLISHPQGRLRVDIGLCCMILAALCKQAFYPMPLVGLSLIWLLHGRNSFFRAGGLNLGLLLLVGAFIHGWDPAFLPAMLSQITGATTLTDLYAAGIAPYLKPLVLVVIPLLICWQAMSLYKWRLFPAGLFWAVFVGLIGIQVYRSWHMAAYQGPGLGFAQAFWLIGVGLAIKSVWVNKTAYGLILGMLVLAWCSGISWGYASPMLYFTPILFTFLLGLKEELDFRVPRYFFALLGTFLIWSFAMLYQFPYRDQPRADLYYPLAQVFPKMEGVYTGKEMFRKSQELLRFQRHYGDRFSVLPAFPMAHYLLDLNSPLGIDWAHNAECLYDQREAYWIAALSQLDYVLLQPDKQHEWGQEGPYGCKLAGYVQQNWIKTEEGEYFWLYRPPTISMNQPALTSPSGFQSVLPH